MPTFANILSADSKRTLEFIGARLQDKAQRKQGKKATLNTKKGGKK